MLSVKPRVHVELVVSQTDLETVRSALESDLAGRARFALDAPVKVAQTSEGTWLIVCQVRFEDAAGAQQWFDRVVSRWTSGQLANRIVAGSRVTRHDCPHDESVGQPCVVSSQAVK